MHILMHYVGRKSGKDATIPCRPFNNFIKSSAQKIRGRGGSSVVMQPLLLA